MVGLARRSAQIRLWKRDAITTSARIISSVSSVNVVNSRTRTASSGKPGHAAKHGGANVSRHVDVDPVAANQHDLIP